MTTSGKITCPKCGGSMGESCDCVTLILNGRRVRSRFHGNGRFDGPITITESGHVAQPKPHLLDNQPLWWTVFTLVVLTIVGGIAALVIVFKP